MDPGGENESYEYVDEKEIDSRKKEERGTDDGDRLVGGKITNTRFTKQVIFQRKKTIFSGNFLSWLGGTSMAIRA